MEAKRQGKYHKAHSDLNTPIRISTTYFFFLFFLNRFLLGFLSRLARAAHADTGRFHAVILSLARSSVASAGFFFVSQFIFFFFCNKKRGARNLKIYFSDEGPLFEGFFFLTVPELNRTLWSARFLLSGKD